jgi:Uma2 family endonuclease
MSIAHQHLGSSIAPAVLPRPTRVLPLENGDHLTRAEFERRYQAVPETKKAELIEGVVFMPSPVRMQHHAEPHANVVAWISYYKSKTPHVRCGDNGTNRLDEDNEPQPDVMMLLPRWAGGSAVIDGDDYVAGAPAFVCEISASSVSIDMHAKLRAYRRNGVKEYLVWRTEEGIVDWFELQQGSYVPLPADEKGLVRSRVFPGLWLDVPALFAGDLQKVFAAVDEGAATKEHRAFVNMLNDLAAKESPATE